MRQELRTLHFHTERGWAHIVSVMEVPDQVVSALLYANDVLCARFTPKVARYIQPVEAFAHIGIEAECGVGILPFPELDVQTHTFLMSNDVYAEFSKFYSEPANFKGVEALLETFHRHRGLICGLSVAGPEPHSHDHAEAHHHDDSDRATSGEEADDHVHEGAGHHAEAES